MESSLPLFLSSSLPLFLSSSLPLFLSLSLSLSLSLFSLSLSLSLLSVYKLETYKKNTKKPHIYLLILIIKYNIKYNIIGYSTSLFSHKKNFYRNL